MNDNFSVRTYNRSALNLRRSHDTAFHTSMCPRLCGAFESGKGISLSLLSLSLPFSHLPKTRGNSKKDVFNDFAVSFQNRKIVPVLKLV